MNYQLKYKKTFADGATLQLKKYQGLRKSKSTFVPLSIPRKKS